MASQRRAIRSGERDLPRVERNGSLVVVRALGPARQVLRARDETTQAGFTAESVPKGALKHHPILMSDGPLHDEQRKKVARFFAPAVVTDRYGEVMRTSACRLLDAAQSGPPGRGDARDGVLLDTVALEFTVEVTAQAVGLTESSVPAMARRLVTFFNQPPFDLTQPRLGRTGRQWAQAAFNGLVPIVRFYLADVRPAIRSRRRHRRDDVISHLLDEGYTNTDILVECVTYGTAGMVTTREFILMAAWHLLTDAELRVQFENGQQSERMHILAEIMRLEPVVGHFYRRAQTRFEITDQDQTWTIEPGDLIDLQVRPAHLDPDAVGADPGTICPGRAMPAGVGGVGLAFGDGAHKCPGQPLALHEAEVFLAELLSRNPEIVTEPVIGWDDLIAGYNLRGFTVRFPPG